MVVLIDTNVVLDYLSLREGLYENAKKIMQLCVDGEIDGYIAFHTVPNVYYILRTNFSASQRREMLLELCDIVTVISANHSGVVKAIENDEFSDLEDCLQDECAKMVRTDYIITRNIDDYKHSDTKAISPEDFLNLV
ncbi:MAG: PIN domain-containing protein [Lachnospiraceae bacterium]|nr:PIN domain-containing protein [Lachnospiraceae bacterium]